MYPDQFEYLSAETTSEAISLLQEYDDTELLAGGQSLIPLQKTRLATPDCLIDINRVDALDYIVEDDDTINIGAMTRHTPMQESPLVLDHLFLFSECISQIADRPVRNQGTMGGTIAEADPSGDYLPVLKLLNPDIVVTGPDGERVTTFEDLYLGLFSVDLEEAELITEVRLPKLAPTADATAVGSTYQKHAERSGDYAIVGEAAIVHIDDSGTITDANLAVGSVGPLTRVEDAETCIEGTPLSESALEEAAAMTRESVSPDEGEDGEYKKAMAGEFTKRSFQIAYDRAME